VDRTEQGEHEGDDVDGPLDGVENGLVNARPSRKANSQGAVENEKWARGTATSS
jgi:hypothetical protein